LPRGKVLKPNSIILVDGLWLWPRATLRVLFSARIFIECSFRTRLHRRLSRDLLSRGRSAASARAQFKRTVEPMHRRFVAPQVLWANIVLQGSCDKRRVAKIASTIREQAARGSGLLRP
jgi:uridine kinase